MRRKISLYIKKSLVDLDDQSFILFNYTMEDLRNPTTVKNSFSRQITLKGTPNNNKIFGDVFRLDRVTDPSTVGTGMSFNASRKTPFTIYNEMNEMLESGYVKLDGVLRTGASVEYKVTLYGELGSFLYSLMYDADGNKLKLSSLTFKNEDIEQYMTFKLTANEVKAAWNYLIGGSTTNARRWSVINFAPCYNGIPQSNFDANKAIVSPGDIGLPTSKTESDGTYYSTQYGYTLVTFAEKHDEWTMKDLRSYLQRPVLSVRALLDALANPLNNGGFTVNMSELLNYPIADLWITLPIFSQRNVEAVNEDVVPNFVSQWTDSQFIADIIFDRSYPSEAVTTLQCSLQLSYMPGDPTMAPVLTSSEVYQSGDVETVMMSVFFIQLVAYDVDDQVIGGSQVTCLGNVMNLRTEEIGYQPLFSAPIRYFLDDMIFEAQSDGSYKYRGNIVMSMEGAGVSYVKVDCRSYNVVRERVMSTGQSSIVSISGGEGSGAVLYDGADYPTRMSSARAAYTTLNAHVETGAGGSVYLTKNILLNTEHTPADYLLSFCKAFGLHILYNAATKQIDIVSRNSLYTSEVVDISERIDRGKDISFNPIAFDAKWYDMELQSDGGAFMDEYSRTYGVPYGVKQVNTNFEFNSDHVNMMDSVIFKRAATILGRSKYYNDLTYLNKKQPSPFVDTGNKFTLWNETQGAKDFQIDALPSSVTTVAYFNNAFRGYDYPLGAKMEFRDAEGKPLAGDNVLVFLDPNNPSVRYQRLQVTDNPRYLDELNNGVPCWFIGNETAMNIPNFRTLSTDGTEIYDSLDFGSPREIQMPEVIYPAGVTIYDKYWKNYLRDRYDINTKVVTCKVHFDGMQVNSELLRKFYWFDNSLWVLNAIKNHSLTTFDPVECEFVQVQNKWNYTNGQTF